MRFDEPLLLRLRCWECKHEWDGFFPDGLESRVVECPECHYRTSINYALIDQQGKEKDGG